MYHLGHMHKEHCCYRHHKQIFQFLPKEDLLTNSKDRWEVELKEKLRTSISPSGSTKSYCDITGPLPL